MDTTHVIPKKEFATYQKWQFDSFNTSDSPKPPDSAESSHQNEVTLPSEEQIADIYQQAQKEGYAAGFQAGRTAGHQEGKQQAEVEVKAEVERLQALLSGFDKELHEMDQQVAQDLLKLSLDLAKQMITQALQIRPELVLPVVQQAIRHVSKTMHPHLILHPDDATLVREQLGDQLSQSDWKIHEDAQIKRGGCRIEANGSEIDASMETRWQRIVATIGLEDGWLK